MMTTAMEGLSKVGYSGLSAQSLGKLQSLAWGLFDIAYKVGSMVSAWISGKKPGDTDDNFEGR